MGGGVSTSASPPGPVGERVTIRLIAGESTRDLVGVLETPTSVRRRDGSLVGFDLEKIVAWRRVAPHSGRPRSIRIREIEMAQMATWAPTEVELHHEWALRAAAGYSYRANSALPTGPAPFGTANIAEAIKATETFYSERGLPPTIQVLEPGSDPLAQLLRDRGWSPGLAALVFTASVTELRAAALPSDPWPVVIEDQPSAEWLAAHGRELGAHGLAVLASGGARFWRAEHEGQTIGIARAAEAVGWLGLSAIEVAPVWRRKGVATALIKNIAENSESATAFLQVNAENVGGQALYEGLGFRYHHGCRYWSLRSTVKIGLR
jgi:N-acetylglutamate synthase